MIAFIAFDFDSPGKSWIAPPPLSILPIFSIFNFVYWLLREEFECFYFYKLNYTGKPYFYTIVASKEKVNLTDLGKYGKVIEVSIEDIFGY